MVKKKGGGVKQEICPQLNLGIKQYIKAQIQYQEANTINNAGEIKTKWKMILDDAQMQGGMMTWAWYNYDATIIYLK